MPQKTWVIGEEALATDFNTYVQNQIIARFATSAARDASWPAATAGNGAYADTADSGTLWRSNGSTWLPVAGSSPWTNVTFTAGWTNFAGGEELAQYRKVGDTVQVRGVIVAGNVAQGAFQLPTGFRPQGNLHRAAQGASATVRLDISAGGVFTPQTSGGVWVDISTMFSTSA